MKDLVCGESLSIVCLVQRTTSGYVQYSYSFLVVFLDSRALGHHILEAFEEDTDRDGEESDSDKRNDCANDGAEGREVYLAPLSC